MLRRAFSSVGSGTPCPHTQLCAVSQAIHPDDVVQLEAVLQQALRGGRFYDFTYRIRWPDNSEHQIHGRGEVVFDDIPIAEETGLIAPIGKWVLQMACAQLRQLENDPSTRNFPLAVNISARQFRQLDFVDEVLEVLEKTRADPRKLKLELTESLVLQDIAHSIEKWRYYVVLVYVSRWMISAPDMPLEQTRSTRVSYVTSPLTQAMR